MGNCSSGLAHWTILNGSLSPPYGPFLVSTLNNRVDSDSLLLAKRAECLSRTPVYVGCLTSLLVLRAVYGNQLRPGLSCYSPPPGPDL